MVLGTKVEMLRVISLWRRLQGVLFVVTFSFFSPPQIVISSILYFFWFIADVAARGSYVGHFKPCIYDIYSRIWNNITYTKLCGVDKGSSSLKDKILAKLCPGDTWF